MADKISKKTAIFISFLCGIVMVLCACMPPVDIQLFMEDEQVQIIIEASRVAVKVDDKTGDGLVGRSRKIEGLKPNKYYMVEKEVDADGINVPDYFNQGPYPMYVTDYPGLGPGGLFDDLGFITRIKAGSINDLTNYHTYTVRAAVPLRGNGVLYSDSVTNNYALTITDGTIKIPSLAGTGRLNLSSVLSGNYEVIAVSVNAPSTSPGSWNWTSKDADLDSFTLEGVNTQVDYVFVNKDDSSDFKVLNVVMPTTINIAAIAGVTVPVTGATPGTAITETLQYTGTITWSPTDNPFNASTVYTATITLTPKEGFTPSGVSADFFTVAGATTVNNPINSGVITAVFPQTAAAPSSGITLTITFDGKVTTISSGTANIAIGALNESNTVTLTLDNGTTYTNIQWYHNGSLLAGETGTTLLLKNSVSAVTSYMVVGKHIFTVYCETGGIPYSASFTLTVTE